MNLFETLTEWSTEYHTSRRNPEDMEANIETLTTDELREAVAILLFNQPMQ